MNINLLKSILNQSSSIEITGSKSESNRLLLLQALYSNLSLDNVSNSDDSQLMQKALLANDGIVDIHHAGTAMRFLTAFFATQVGEEIVLTGSNRMQERPIQILVEALRQLGADINYENEEGYPPLKIKGKVLKKHQASLRANVSSQYISALLLIAPRLKNGIELTLEGNITSVPYINMTLKLLNEVGVETSFEDNVIIVKPNFVNPEPITLIVESDWSSASYYFSCIALSAIGTEITLSSYKRNSLQGDSSLVKFYKEFGVETKFNEHSITLKKITQDLSPKTFNLINAPDIAQTIAVTCLGLGIECYLTGLHTLKIKETDRLQALKNEIEKFGTQVIITNETLNISNVQNLKTDVIVNTYHDHRMAMAFAPLALCVGFQINDADVVSKSYPDFWNDFKKIGFALIEN
ncbi:3-phosphoshikimate 1-carboxyvinyltransferase [Flavobacteriaceae bacterium AU392]|nr:3-phosphoshikimate 1-carboxyvinyltransferase [Flavobacteriaceae bacterium]RKM81518.1 3-phosphoshikimate 1-carboxyvinyltransferase [Flavobacteriaceae bacterium AU392]